MKNSGLKEVSVPDPRNPYAPPKAPVCDRADRPDPDSHDVFIPNGRRVPPGILWMPLVLISTYTVYRDLFIERNTQA